MLQLTPLIADASEASLVSSAPVELVFMSNQDISCLNMALKLRYLSLLVIRSPATEREKFYTSINMHKMHINVTKDYI